MRIGSLVPRDILDVLLVLAVASGFVLGFEVAALLVCVLIGVVLVVV